MLRVWPKRKKPSTMAEKIFFEFWRCYIYPWLLNCLFRHLFSHEITKKKTQQAKKHFIACSTYQQLCYRYSHNCMYLRLVWVYDCIYVIELIWLYVHVTVYSNVCILMLVFKCLYLNGHTPGNGIHSYKWNTMINDNPYDLILLKYF